jgi:hypothetical protein
LNCAHRGFLRVFVPARLTPSRTVVQKK